MQSQLYIMHTFLQKFRYQKLKISSFFLIQRSITLSKIIIPETRLNLNCVILWHIHQSNLRWMCSSVVKIMKEKLNHDGMMDERMEWSVMPQPFYGGAWKLIISPSLICPLTSGAKVKWEWLFSLYTDPKSLIFINTLKDTCIHSTAPNIYCTVKFVWDEHGSKISYI